MGLPFRHDSRATLFLTLPLLALVLVTVADTALADPWHGGNNARFRAPSHSFGTNFSRHATPVARYSSRNDFRRNDFYNPRFRPAGNRFRHVGGFYDNRFYNSRSYNSRYYNDSWSVSLNLGSGWNSGFGGLYYGTGYNTGLWNRPYAPYRNTTTVVYRQPTVVVVNDSPRVSGRVIDRSVRTTAPKPSRSLLRDIHGDCWERTYDSRGVETRLPLPESACRF